MMFKYDLLMSEPKEVVDEILENIVKNNLRAGRLNGKDKSVIQKEIIAKFRHPSIVKFYKRIKGKDGKDKVLIVLNVWTTRVHEDRDGLFVRGTEAPVGKEEGKWVYKPRKCKIYVEKLIDGQYIQKE